MTGITPEYVFDGDGDIWARRSDGRYVMIDDLVGIYNGELESYEVNDRTLEYVSTNYKGVYDTKQGDRIVTTKSVGDRVEIRPAGGVLYGTITSVTSTDNVSYTIQASVPGEVVK